MRAKTRLFPCVVLASLRGSTYRSVRLVSRSLRPCLGLGASLGEEAVLADSGRAGEVAAGVGRVRCLAFLSILRLFWLQHRTGKSNYIFGINRAFPQPGGATHAREEPCFSDEVLSHGHGIFTSHDWYGAAPSPYLHASVVCREPHGWESSPNPADC